MDVYRRFHSFPSIFSFRFYAFCPKFLRGCPVFPAPSRQPDKIGRAEQDLDRRRAGRCQTDLKKRHSGHAAHEPGHRDPHTEGSHDPLDHNEKGLTAPVFRRSTRKVPSFSSRHFFISFPASRFFLYLQQIFNALLGLFLLKKIFLIYYNNSTL